MHNLVTSDIPLNYLNNARASHKNFQYFANNSVAPDAFNEVVKVSKHTGL